MAGKQKRIYILERAKALFAVNQRRRDLLAYEDWWKYRLPSVRRRSDGYRARDNYLIAATGNVLRISVSLTYQQIRR